MACCGSMFKFFVFLFNFIFFLAGVSIIGIGSYMAIKMKDYFDFLSLSDLAPGVGVSSYVFIGVGLLIAIISFLGCWGACTDNKCMMGTFATIMAIILIAEIGVAITILIYKGKAQGIVEDAMTKGLQNYGKNETEGVTRTLDKIQEQFTCCGIKKPDDWLTTPFGAGPAFNAPDSCCVAGETQGCGAGKLVQPFTDLNSDGCLTKFYDFVENNAFLVGGVGIGIIIIQLISVIAGCCLAKRMGKEEFV
jgi:CD63 antigen